MSKSPRLLAPALAALALAAPAAQAMPAYDPPATTSSGKTVVYSAPRPATPADGFAWGSAAIGAGGVAALLALLSAGAARGNRARLASPR